MGRDLSPEPEYSNTRRENLNIDLGKSGHDSPQTDWTDTNLSEAARLQKIGNINVEA